MLNSQISGNNIISIHAPAKGATFGPGDGENNPFISIHAPAKGATDSAHTISESCKFQSTLPRRGRQLTNEKLLPYVYFNPRSREGGDSASHLTGQSYQYFNPRSREGGDVSFDSEKILAYISIHAPAKGATVT